MKLRKAIFITVLSAVVMAISAVFTSPANAQVRFVSDTLVNVGNTSVKRILPKPQSGSSYNDAHYTDIDFRQNQADLDLSYMNNRKALSQFNDLIDSLGTETIVEIEIIAQASPDGIVSRNIWLAQNRADVMLDYLKKNFPRLKSKFTVNTVNESWDNLAQYVSQDPNLTQEEKKRILDIIESTSLSLGEKKAQIKKVGTNPKVGDIYNDYLFKYYYPAIKNTGIYVLNNNATSHFIDNKQQSVTYISPTDDRIRIVPDKLIDVGNTKVRRILPKPESDGLYNYADYTDIIFRKNKADLDLGYMNNRRALSHFKNLIDSLGAENIVEIEIIAQASPEGIVSRNVWLAKHRADVMLDYLKKNFPNLNAKFTIHTVNEAWENLAQYVAQDPNLTQEEKKRILDIIESPTLTLGNKKAQIKKVGTSPIVGDIYYDYLFKYYYPAIKNTGIYVLHNNAALGTKETPADSSQESKQTSTDLIGNNQQYVTYLRPTDQQIRIVSDQLINVGNTMVKRILPIPESDSLYIDADYTDIDFRKNNADLELGYMNNRKALSHFDDLIDSLGAENIVEIEIIAQASPEGIVSRNIWLAQHRADVMLDYLKKNYPSLNAKFTVHTVNESWDNLAQYVIHDPNLSQEEKERILDIIESPTLTLGEKKAQIKKVGRNSKVGDIYYDYLFKYYYPAIRNTGIYVLHNYVAPVIPDMEMLPISVVEEGETTTPDIIISDVEQPEPIVITPPEIIRKRPIIAVKTNLPYDAYFRKDLGWAPIYNVEAEWYLTENGRWTLLGEYEFPWHMAKDNHECFQIMNLQLEARRYFKKDSRHSGHYLSAYLGANLFDICFDGYSGHGYQGEGMGGGLGYGYVLPLGKKPDTRWKLEFLIKGGVYMTLYDPYDAGNPFSGKYYYEWYDAPDLFMRRNMVFRWLGPTGVGINLSYDLIRKKVKDK